MARYASPLLSLSTASHHATILERVRRSPTPETLLFVNVISDGQQVFTARRLKADFCVGKLVFLGTAWAAKCVVPCASVGSDYEAGSKTRHSGIASLGLKVPQNWD